MKHRGNGFATLELVVAVGIIGLIAGGAASVVYRAVTDTQRTNDHLTAVRQVENAANWIGRDARMADILITTNLTSPAILILKWTEWGYGTDSIYHQATYSVVSGNVTSLKRRHESSTGINEEVMVGNYIYYNPADVDNTTNITYQSPILSLRVAASCGAATAKKEFQIYRRPNFMGG